MDDNSYFGVYRGIVIDNADPLNLGRLRLKIPQVSGENVTEWAFPMIGAQSQQRLPYITATSTTSQTVTAANTATLVNFTNVEFSNNIELVDGNKIVFTEYGEYFLQFSAVFAKSTSTAANVDIWYRYNGADIPRSSTRVVTTGNPNEVTVGVSGIMPIEPDDYIQLAFSSPNELVTLTAFTGLTNPTRPDVPGVVFSANLVGKWKPRPDTGVWVMFEGGNPNFPVWMGGF